MSLRGLVTGADGCGPSGTVGPTNPLGRLADAVLGAVSRTKDQVQELPRALDDGAGPSSSSSLPPMMDPRAMSHGNQALVHEFLHHQHQQHQHQHHPQASTAAMEDAFRQSFHLHPPPPPSHPPPSVATPESPGLDILSSSIHSFLRGVRGVPSIPLLPLLSVQDQCRIRDRSSILARHVYSDPVIADQRAKEFLFSLSIHPDQLPIEAPSFWNQVWDQGSHAPPPLIDQVMAGRMQAAMHPYPPPPLPPPSFLPATRPGDSWANQFTHHHAPSTLPHSTEVATSSQWADQFAPSSTTTTTTTEAAATTAPLTDTADMHDPARVIMETMKQSDNPKFQNSKFLQFLSKMSQGGSIDIATSSSRHVGAEWAQEHSMNRGVTRNEEEEASYGHDYALEGHLQSMMQKGREMEASGLNDVWAQEFAQSLDRVNLTGFQAPLVDDADPTIAAWMKEFQSQGDAQRIEDEWASDFTHQHQQHQQQQEREALRHAPRYTFTHPNPFLGDTNAYDKGQRLFAEGLLGEAALAVEAALQSTSSPPTAEAWQFLGMVHAENDNDQRAISAMKEALVVDPHNADVALALGVSYTNELEVNEAVEYLTNWLSAHPTFGGEARRRGVQPLDASQHLSHAVHLFESIAERHASSPDLQVALGVLYNLQRSYDAALACFARASQHRSDDYSLWNKMGATLANSGRSEQAIEYYQKALELKPNYVRGWVNMGVSHSNVGDYQGAARYYLRALEMNRENEQVWGYLRTVLICHGRVELVEAANEHDADRIKQQLGFE